MNIAVIAANGRSGREFVAAALAAGHHVRAGVYGANTLPEHPKLISIECNATDPSDVKRLIEGTDAVASFIGHGRKSPANVQTEAITTLLDVMHEIGLSRIVSLTGTGVRFPGDKITLMDRFFNLSIGIIDPKRVKDGIAHVRVLEKSDSDWTVIRVLKLSNQEVGAYKLSKNGPTKVFTPRREVALACLEVLEQNSFIGEAPIVCKAKP